MNNVVKFPKAPAVQQALHASVEEIQEARTRGATIKAVLNGLFVIVRLMVFLVMYWLRLPVVLVCELISIPMLFLWLFSLYAFPDKQVMVWGFGVISFIAFSMAWVYDFLLMALSPQDMVRTL